MLIRVAPSKPSCDHADLNKPIYLISTIHLEGASPPAGWIQLRGLASIHTLVFTPVQVDRNLLQTIYFPSTQAISHFFAFDFLL
jgi:hypothetical protein